VNNVYADDGTDTPMPEQTQTATWEPLFRTSTPAPTVDYSCPTGQPSGWGEVTPDVIWSAYCGNCIKPNTPVPLPGSECFCATQTAIASSSIGINAVDPGDDSGASDCMCGTSPQVTPTYTGQRYYSVDASYFDVDITVPANNTNTMAIVSSQFSYPQDDSCPVGGQVGITYEVQEITTDTSQNATLGMVDWKNQKGTIYYTNETSLKHGICWTKPGQTAGCYVVMPNEYGRTVVNSWTHDIGYWIISNLTKNKSYYFETKNTSVPTRLVITGAKWLCDSQAPDDTLYLKRDRFMDREEEGKTDNSGAITSPITTDNKCGTQGQVIGLYFQGAVAVTGWDFTGSADIGFGPVINGNTDPVWRHTTGLSSTGYVLGIPGTETWISDYLRYTNNITVNKLSQHVEEHMSETWWATWKPQNPSGAVTNFYWLCSGGDPNQEDPEVPGTGYCDVVQPSRDDPIGIGLPGPVIGPKSCLQIGGWTIGLTWLSTLAELAGIENPQSYTVPGFIICLRPIVFGDVNLFGQQVSLDFIAAVMAGVAGIRLMMRS
jgi:hypothetical protein